MPTPGGKSEPISGVNSPRVAFDQFELDLHSGELRKGGRRIRLQAQPFKLLALLIENAGEVVTRDEVCRALWQADTFVDFDHSVAAAVNKIREALCDTAENPRFVETLPRRGYRFIGQVRRELPQPTVLQTAANAKGPARIQAAARFHVTRAKVLVFACVMAIALLVGLNSSRVRERLFGRHSAPRIQSIAVLPLVNLSNDADQDYFADGMTDELITTLAKNRALRITSRTSVMRYKTAQRSIREIAGELGVDGVIVGSVASSGKRLRVNAQLIRASDETHLWSESYERDLGDVLSLQEELARAIAEQVRVTSEPSDLPRASTSARFNPDAHDAYLRGRYSWYQGEYQKSRDFFRKAIDLDPAYAAGYSGLADSYIGQCVSGELPAKEGMPKGEAAAHKALEMDDSLAEAHNSLAAAKLFYHWDWPGAEKEIKRALELNPSFSEAHHLYDYILSTSNRASEGLQQEKIAQELDPIARPWAIGRALLRQRRFDDAIQEFRSQLENEPGDANLHMNLAAAYYFKGMLKEAVTEEGKSLTLAGDSEGAAALASIYKSCGYKATLEWRFNARKKKAKNEYVSPVELAEFSAALGRQDEAIHYLKEAFDQHTARLIWLKQNPYFDSLHSDSRYQAIVKGIGLL
jgi:TolB-like protein/DNA-binding winged helix-turn-helix (wHTH) protein